MPRKAKKSSHHHRLWRTKRNTIRRTKVTIAAKRNRASDASVKQRVGCKIKGQSRRKSGRTLELVETRCHCEEGSGKEKWSGGLSMRVRNWLYYKYGSAAR